MSEDYTAVQQPEPVSLALAEATPPEEAHELPQSRCCYSRTRTRLAAPQGIVAHNRGGGWWYLTWQPVQGATSYEEDHEFRQGQLDGPESTIFAIPNGDSRDARIRALSRSGASPWVRCRLRWDGQLDTHVEGDDPPPPPPGPPAVPQLESLTADQTSVRARWSDDGAAASWETRLLDAHGDILLYGPTDEPRARFSGLAPDTQYGVQARALGPTGAASAWSSRAWTRTEAKPDGPAKPANLAVHCITTNSAQVTWDNDPDVDYWEVGLSGQPVVQVFTNGRRLEKLKPGGSYTVSVVAYRAGKASPAASQHFTTDTEGPKPPPGELPAPANLTVQALDGRSVKAVWEQPGGEVTHWFASIGGRQVRVDKRLHGTTHTFTGLTPGVTHTVAVYAAGNAWKLSPQVRQQVTTPKEAQ